MSTATQSSAPVVIVGAGLAGLSAALELTRQQIPVQIYEATSQVGGRVRTREVAGFLIDRGFQVFLDSYPTASELLDYQALQLRPFAAGARIRLGTKWYTLTDPTRPNSLLGLLDSARAPVGSVADKLRVNRLRSDLLCETPDTIWASPELSTQEYLEKVGIGSTLIERFFRPFYGGVFLENELRTSSRMFQFTFAMFARGNATLPRYGMGAIPAQLASRLPEGILHLNQSIEAITANGLRCNGEVIPARAIIIACNAKEARRLVPELPEIPTKAATTLCFTARGQSQSKLLHLNGNGRGLINHVAFLDAIQAGYAPAHTQLISATILGDVDPAVMVQPASNELRNWFPNLRGLKFLSADRVLEALPEQKPHVKAPRPAELLPQGLFISGDYTRHGSIEGALESGQEVAKQVKDYLHLA